MARHRRTGCFRGVALAAAAACQSLLVCLVLNVACWQRPAASFARGVDTYGELLTLREATREMFHHSFDKYLSHGFPYDELRPLKCGPRRWDRRERGTLDDNLGGFALTLVDAADTLALMGDRAGFQHALDLIKHNVTFNNSIVVSVFETTIRVLGGLLSSHQLASDARLNLVPGYDGWLLDRAIDVGQRMLPAFETDTGIPYHRVHLVKGVPKGETDQTCLAAAGTLLLEFGALSRLTGDQRFERVAARAVDELWKRRSQLNLLGNTINVRTGRWGQGLASTGPGRDSFYEYLLKSYILFGEERYYDMWLKSLQALDSHSSYGPWHAEVDMSAGRSSIRPLVVSSLQAFWPALLVLAGDIDQAQLTFKGYFDLWNVYGSLPEGYQVKAGTPLSYGKDYPLRPELVESAYALFGATNASFYLSFGRTVVDYLQAHCRVPCGFASIADVRTKRLDDRMDSYFLAETLKYLFLMFDAALANIEQHSPASITADDRRRAAEYVPPLRLDPESYIFSTEGHIFRSDIGLHNAEAHPSWQHKRRRRGARGGERESSAVAMAAVAGTRGGGAGAEAGGGDQEQAGVAAGGGGGKGASSSSAAAASSGGVRGGGRGESGRSSAARQQERDDRESCSRDGGDGDAATTTAVFGRRDPAQQTCEVHDAHSDATDVVMAAGSMLKIYSRPETTRPAAAAKAAKAAKAAGKQAETNVQLSSATADALNVIMSVSEHRHVECEAFDDCKFVANPTGNVNVVVSWRGGGGRGGGGRGRGRARTTRNTSSNDAAGRSMTFQAGVAQFGLPLDTAEGHRHNLVPAGSVLVEARPADGCSAAAATNAAEFVTAKAKLSALRRLAGMRSPPAGGGDGDSDGDDGDGTAAEYAVVALVQRGGCTFASKARVRSAMRQLGATSVIVTNNVPGQTRFVMAGDDGDSDTVGGLPRTALAAPGGGADPLSDVSAVMISHDDGQRLRDALAVSRGKETVTVEYKPGDGVDVPVEDTESILSGFREILAAIGMTQFTHPIIFSIERSQDPASGDTRLMVVANKRGPP